MAKHVFDEVKMVDFGWVGVGPLTSQYLAGLGATVVRVESKLRPDMIRSSPPFKDGIPGINRSAFWIDTNENKYGVTLNLVHPKATEVALRLVKWADVITSGFTPGVMERWGLSYQECCKVRPDIIVLNTSQQGQTGPHKQYRGAGPNMTALAGIDYVSGWPDREPILVYAPYSDQLNCRITGLLVMAALDYRRRTGEGQYIDQSQFEGSLQYLAPLLLDYTVNKRVMERMGNRDPNAAPHGAYPCRGEDRWCVIAVFNDQEWHSFCQVIGNPEWTQDSKFATLSARKENEEELDALVAEWTQGYTPEQVMAMMQAAGVAAGVAQDMKDVHSDPQLKHRSHFMTITHSEIGPHLYEARPYKLSKTPEGSFRGAPCIGEHNEYVYKELLGMSDDEIADLMAEGVFE